MLHVRSFNGFSIHHECWNAFRQISSIESVLKEKLKKNWNIQVWVLWRSSRGRPEWTSQGRPLNVRLGHSLDVISGRPQDVRLGRTQDVRSGRPRDGQIGSLGDSLETLEGDVLGTFWGPIFAGWEISFFLLSIFVDELISTPKIITCLPVPLLGCEKTRVYQIQYHIQNVFTYQYQHF